ncbi:MAG: hypothetical protein VB862_13670 [Pirellulaceae bacterium]|nr:hypothetical protein [Planctomycetaceae bacterium]
MPPPTTPPASISAQFKWLLSLLLVMHLAAVVIPPFTFATRTGYESSPLANVSMSVVQPYSNALFLNHGYFFFAPSPGPSHLVEYDVEFKDGDKKTFRFPDLQSQRPRLFYHRHLMLAEWLHANYPATSIPDWVPAEEQRFQQENYQRVVESVRQHLQHRHGAQQVTLRRLEHQLIAPEDYLKGQRNLSAPHLYQSLPIEPASENRP